jgi:hypothetical protein
MAAQENHKTPVGIAGVMAKIQVGDLSNTEQGANHNTTEFSDITDFKS